MSWLFDFFRSLVGYPSPPAEGILQSAAADPEKPWERWVHLPGELKPRIIEDGSPLETAVDMAIKKIERSNREK